jgi:predicted kinase
MYILLNGAFGIGKSSVAVELQRRLAGSTTINPERLGVALRYLPGYHRSDFQHLPAWRRLTVAWGRAMGRLRPVVIVPMAFSELAYLDEVRAGLAASGRPVLHFCLTAPLEVVRERLAARGEPAADRRWAWVHRRAAECCQAHGQPEFAVQVPTMGRSAAAIAADLAQRVLTAP